MCDEYDDERMQAFWRRLEIQEELERQEHESEKIEGPLTVSRPDVTDTRKARPKLLTH